MAQTVDTGSVGGIIRLLRLNSIGLCIKTFIVHTLDGTTSGPKSFSGPIGNAILKCESLPVV